MLETLALGARVHRLQVCTGNVLDGSTRDRVGRPIRQGDTLCLEPQDFPDAPNIPAFGPCELRPGQEWVRRISWTFEPPPR